MRRVGAFFQENKLLRNKLLRHTFLRRTFLRHNVLRHQLLRTALLAGVFISPLAQAELTFGIVAPASGGAAPLGLGMQKGIETYFAEANAAGGVHGEMLALTARFLRRL